MHALNIGNAPICKFVACVAFICNISGYSCGRCPAFTIDTRILMLLGAQVLIHVPIVNFISEFTEEVDALVALSCESLAI